MPEQGISDQLIQVFFNKIHPAYPVLDREAFLRSYYRGEASPLILQTMCMVGFTIASTSLLSAAGYSDRATARKTHYLRAKALYDADYEMDRLTTAAALLLLGFWWANPDDQKDTNYWISCAVNVAQSLGIHRS